MTSQALAAPPQERVALPLAAVFSGAVAVILLALYFYAIRQLIAVNDQQGGASPRALTDAVKTVLDLVGGLVSALVVAVLAVSPPAKRFLSGLPSFRAVSPRTAVAVNVIVCAYLVVWLACGVMLLWAWIGAASPIEELASAAKSWLGLAVAAAYAYLGIQPGNGGRGGHRIDGEYT